MNAEGLSTSISRAVYLVAYCAMHRALVSALDTMQRSATITSKALLPRGSTDIFGWYSTTNINGVTPYLAIAFDAGSPTLSSTSNYWIDWCTTAWCDHYTYCQSGTLAGPRTTKACVSTSSSSCKTEALLPSYGATVPLLRKIDCTIGTSRIYYQNSPLSSYTYPQPAIDWAATTDPATLSSSFLSTSTATSTTTLLGVISSSTAASPATTSSLLVSSTSEGLSASSTSPNDKGSSGNTSIIAGSVVGGVALIGIFILAAIFIIRKTRRHKSEPQGPYNSEADDMQYHKSAQPADTTLPSKQVHELDSPWIGAAYSSRGVEELQGDTHHPREKPGDGSRY